MQLIKCFSLNKSHDSTHSTKKKENTQKILATFLLTYALLQITGKIKYSKNPTKGHNLSFPDCGTRCHLL